MIILKIGLVLGMIGHAVNLWCDRVLSVTPNGKITLATMKEIDNPEGMAQLYEGVDASVPMKSAIFGIMSLVLEFFGYFSIAYFVHSFSVVFGIILFVCGAVFALAYFGYIIYVVTLIVSICMQVCELPLWSLVFTVLPIFIALTPFKIIGTLHISAMITFLDWVLFANVKRIRLPGTENMDREYHQKWFHVKVCLPMIPVFAVIGVLSSLIMVWIW